MKKFFSALGAIVAILPVTVFSAFADDPYTDTRYNDFSPAESVEDFINGTVTPKAIEAYNKFIQMYYGYVGGGAYGLLGASEEELREFQSYVDMLKVGDLDSSAFDSIVHAQRIKDLVDYANGSTSGLTTGQSVVTFTAKRKLITGSHNGELTYELDTMYYWRDFNHTSAVDFTGITIGNFFLQPNTIYVTRQFSNGDFDAFYTDATQFELVQSTSTSGIEVNPFSLKFREGATYYVYDSDGTVEQLTFKSNSTAWQNSTLRFKTLDNQLNAISLDGFYRQAQYYPNFGRFVHDGKLTNIQLFCNNAMKDDGSGDMMRPNNYAGSAEGWGTWYLSSGSFIGNSLNSLGIVSRSFTTNDNNYDARKPPANYNVDPNLVTDTLLTTNNVSNYYDYGVSYNSNTNQFELDVNALAAGIAGLITPDFNANFGLVYDNQPDIGGNNWSTPDNNYNTDFDNTITDISNAINSLLPSSGGGWTPPEYPAITTVNPPSILGTMTYPVETRPAEYDDAVNVLWDTGTEMTETTGLLHVFLFMAIIGLAVYILM